MEQFIDSMNVIRSQVLVGPSVTIENPSWDDVEGAISKLDGNRNTAVELHRYGDEPWKTFLIVGGAGRWYMGDSVLRWEFDNQAGSEDLVGIWSDMDFECKARNLLTDEKRVLRIAKRYYETGSYEGLGSVG